MARFESDLNDSAFPVEIFTQDTAAGPVVADEHWHDCFEMLYMLEGHAEQWVNGHRFTMGSGDILLLHSGDIHATLCPAGEHTRIFVLKFMPSVLDARYTRTAYTPIHLAGFINRNSGAGPLDECHCDALIPLLQEIRRENDAQQPGCDFYIKSCILRLVGYLVRHDIIRTLSYDHVEPAAENLGRIIQYMEEHYADDITLEDIAGMAHMNYSYASRYFKKLTGRNFKQYLDYIRVTEATIRLLGGATVTETAGLCGFSCPQALDRTFRRIMGCPPTAFKRSYR